jgi:hypothetical protein
MSIKYLLGFVHQAQFYVSHSKGTHINYIVINEAFLKRNDYYYDYWVGCWWLV